MTTEHNPGEPEFGEHADEAPHNPGEPEFEDSQGSDDGGAAELPDGESDEKPAAS